MTEEEVPEDTSKGMSQTIGKLAAALAKAQGGFGNVTETRTGQEGHRKYQYADLGSYLDAVRDPLSRNGLAYVQRPTEATEGKVSVETILMHESGEWISGRLELASKSDAKAQGSAITYARRYSLVAVLGLAPADDDDGTAAGKPNEPKASVLPHKLIRILDLWRGLDKSKEDLGKLLKKKGVSKLSELSDKEQGALLDRLEELDRNKQAKETF